MATIPRANIFPIVPPESRVADDGSVVHVLAEWVEVTEFDVERRDFAFMATVPYYVIRQHEEGVTPAEDGFAVTGFVDPEEPKQITTEWVNSRKSHWYDRATEKRIKAAQKRVARLLLSHLGM